MSKTGARIVERTEMRSITSPGFAMQVDKAKYDAMKDALLAAIPVGEPGLTVAEIKARALPLRPEAQFPDRKSVVEGKSVSVRVDLGVRLSMKKKIVVTHT